MLHGRVGDVSNKLHRQRTVGSARQHLCRVPANVLPAQARKSLCANDPSRTTKQDVDQQTHSQTIIHSAQTKPRQGTTYRESERT